jgi:hypothetical protein
MLLAFDLFEFSSLFLSVYLGLEVSGRVRVIGSS